jgi:hypothetical protein
MNSYKYLLLVISIIFVVAISAKADTQYKEPEFYSKGMLDENHQFVCIDNQRWLQTTEPDKIILEKLYYTDDETGEVIAYECL